jgi:transcriptional regulator NrdR family protein
MLKCSRCESLDVARWPGRAQGQHNHQCRNCEHTWSTIEVLEEYLRQLINRSIALAAMERKSKEQQ